MRPARLCSSGVLKKKLLYSDTKTLRKLPTTTQRDLGMLRKRTGQGVHTDTGRKSVSAPCPQRDHWLSAQRWMNDHIMGTGHRNPAQLCFNYVFKCVTIIVPGNHVYSGASETNNKDKQSTRPHGLVISTNKTARRERVEAAYSSSFST